MSGLTSLETIPEIVKPLIRKYVGLHYKDSLAVYKKIFDIMTAKDEYDEFTSVAGLPLLVETDEGVPSPEHGLTRAYRSLVRQVDYRGVHAVTEKTLRYSKAGSLAIKSAKHLMKAADQTIDTICALYLDRASNDSYPISLSEHNVGIMSKVHPLADGSTASNEIPNNTALSQASIEEIHLLMIQAVNELGLPMADLEPGELIIPPGLSVTADKILGTRQEVDTANNTINPIVVNGYSKGKIVNKYLANTTQHFIRARNIEAGLMLLQSRAPKINTYADFDREIMKISCAMSFAPHTHDWRALYGSTGA